MKKFILLFLVVSFLTESEIKPEDAASKKKKSSIIINEYSKLIIEYKRANLTDVQKNLLGKILIWAIDGGSEYNDIKEQISFAMNNDAFKQLENSMPQFFSNLKKFIAYMNEYTSKLELYLNFYKYVYNDQKTIGPMKLFNIPNPIIYKLFQKKNLVSI